MSLLCLSAADVARVTSKFSPIALQTLMAHVFFVLTHNNDTETPQSYTPPRITIPTQNHTALFMPARISQAHPAMLRGTSIKVVCIPTSPTDVRGLPASTLVLDEETGAVKVLILKLIIGGLKLEISTGHIKCRHYYSAQKRCRQAISLNPNLFDWRERKGSLLSSNLIGLRTPANVVAFGAGAQIAAHLDLHLRAFPSIYTCTIVNRSVNERASKLADHLRAHFPVVQISTLAHDASAPSPNPALRDALLTANLIICATSSTVPLFPSSWVSDGTHIVLIGSYKHTMHEVDEALIRRALPSDVNAQSSLIVDSSSACLAEAGELISAGIERREVVEIGELVSFGADGGLLDAARQPPLGEMEARGTTGPVTIFKSVGVGLQDVAIACAVVQKAEELGIGQYVNWA